MRQETRSRGREVSDGGRKEVPDCDVWGEQHQNHRLCFLNASTSTENTEDRAWGGFAENILHQEGDR